MGQMEVLEIVNKLGFTTLKELKEEIKLAERSITHALSKLVKYNDIEKLSFGVRNIYFSDDFSTHLKNETRTLDQV